MRGLQCKNACRDAKPSEGILKVEPMFDTRKTISGHLANAVDLTIDFATLGEYGLEPVDAPSPSCEIRHRPGSPRSTGAWNSAIRRFSVQP
jgi:hypothetical protein